jgi:hypothetical protein
MKTIPRAPSKMITKPRMPPPTKRTTKPYIPNLNLEKAFWKPKINEVIKIMNPLGLDPSSPGTFSNTSSMTNMDEAYVAFTPGRLELMTTANCCAIVLLEDFLDGMSQHPSRRSDFFAMKIHILLAGLIRGLQPSNEHLEEAEKLYEEVLEEYPSEGESDIKKMGEFIRELRETMGGLEMSKKRVRFDNEEDEDI